MLVAVDPPLLTVSEPVTVASVMPVPAPEPPLFEATVVKFIPRATPLALMAGGACAATPGAVVGVPGPVGTLMGPPPGRVMPVPAPEPPLFEATVVKFIPRATPLALMAGAACAATPVAVIELPAPVVTLMVPPPERFMPVPFEVVRASVAKVSVAPVFVPD